MNFYSHAPRGARLIFESSLFVSQPFLLTRPSRGATLHSIPFWLSIRDFYSHAPRGARQINFYDI